MTFKSIACALLFAIGAGMAGPAAAAATWPPPDLTALVSACHTHPGITSMAAGGSVAGAPAIDRLCGCFVGKLDQISQSDADLLTRDLLGTSSDAERQADPTYKQLSDLAGTALDACTQSLRQAEDEAAPVEPAPAPQAEAPPVPAPAPPVAEVAPMPEAQPSRMSAEAVGFLETCVASPPFQAYLSKLGSGDSDRQGGICTCLTGALADKVASADFPVLALDFAAERTAPPVAGNYEAAAGIARESLRGCMREAGIKPDF